jgi:hypothetical protein
MAAQVSTASGSIPVILGMHCAFLPPKHAKLIKINKRRMPWRIQKYLVKRFFCTGSSILFFTLSELSVLN